jgi:hypothetical protein
MNGRNKTLHWRLRKRERGRKGKRGGVRDWSMFLVFGVSYIHGTQSEREGEREIVASKFVTNVPSLRGAFKICSKAHLNTLYENPTAQLPFKPGALAVKVKVRQHERKISLP